MVSSLRDPLDLERYPRIKGCDLRFKDVGTKFVETPTGPQRVVQTIYFVLPDYLMGTDMIRWLRCLISFGTVCQQRRAVLPDKSTIWLLDEFGKLKGNIRAITEGFSIFAGYKIQLIIYLQGLGQLRSFAPELWETMLANSNSIFFGLGPLDKFTPQHVSDALGKTLKQRTDSGGTIRGLFKPKVVSETAVSFLSPDEVAKMLSKSSNQLIAFPVDGLPMRLERLAFKPITISNKRFKTIALGGLRGHYFDESRSYHSLYQKLITFFKSIKIHAPWFNFLKN